MKDDGGGGGGGEFTPIQHSEFRIRLGGRRGPRAAPHDQPVVGPSFGDESQAKARATSRLPRKSRKKYSSDDPNYLCSSHPMSTMGVGVASLSWPRIGVLRLFDIRSALLRLSRSGFAVFHHAS